MTKDDLLALAADLANDTKRFINEKLAPLESRLTLLEVTFGGADATTAKALPSKPRIRHCGHWTPGREYAAGDAAVHNGRLFVCTCNNVRSGPPDAGGASVWRTFPGGL